MTLPRNQILIGDAAERLRELPGASIDTAVFSPPYYSQRDYGVSGQLGLETTVDDWVRALRPVLRQVARVLKPTGSAWINVGDSYSRGLRYGAAPKSLLLAPERLALALLADGWIVRNRIAWTKPNGMPTSTADRLSSQWEFVYFVTRTGSYYFDLDAVRVPHTSRGRRTARTAPRQPPQWAGPLAGTQAGLLRARRPGEPGHPLGKNPSDSWPIATAGFRGAHFAVFPERLVERPVLAACPEAVCTRCGKPWTRQRIVAGVVRPRIGGGQRQVVSRMGRGPLLPACECDAAALPGVVLDPFLGSGTTAVVARRFGRDFVGIELSPEYHALAVQRLAEAAA